jgi:hypothetical protein
LCLFIGYNSERLFVDVAGLPLKQLLDLFPDLANKTDRFIFGSDWPGIPSTIKKNIATVQNMPISESGKKAILYENAQRILGRY